MIFADTSYFLALVNPGDVWHATARGMSAALAEPLLSTDWVLAELTDAMSKGRNRATVVSFLRMLRWRKEVTLIAASRELFDRGLELFANRPDKEWSLTDCTSFVIMEDHGVRSALTADHHFEQAGFEVLLRLEQ